MDKYGYCEFEFQQFKKLMIRPPSGDLIQICMLVNIGVAIA